VTFDLGSKFRSAASRSVLERLGSQAWTVPTEAHWPSAAEKSKELLRIELDAVLVECPELSARGAFAAAIHRTNERAMWAYDMARRTVHLGRTPNALRLRQNLFAQEPDWLPPGISDVEMFLSACDEKRQDHQTRTARARLVTALTRRLTSPDPLILENGDLFFVLALRPGLGKVWLQRPGNLFGRISCSRNRHLGTPRHYSTHITRCLLHKRSAHNPARDNTTDPVLPENRDRSFETEVTLADIGSNYPMPVTLDHSAETDENFNILGDLDQLVPIVPESDVPVLMDYGVAAQTGEPLVDQSVLRTEKDAYLPELRTAARDFGSGIEIAAASGPLEGANDSRVNGSPADGRVGERYPFSSQSETQASQPPEKAEDAFSPPLNDLLTASGVQPLADLQLNEMCDSPTIPQTSSADPTKHDEPNIVGQSMESAECTLDPVTSTADRKREVSSESSNSDAESEESRRNTTSHRRKRFRTYMTCYVPTTRGFSIARIGLVDNSRKRTRVVDADEAMRLPNMREAMNKEIASFRAMKCIESVDMRDVPS
jgi:hypothetical protein